MTELSTLSPEAIVSSFTDEERKVYEELKTLIFRTTVDELRGRYAIALKVHEVYNKAKENRELYGQQFLKRLALALGFKSDIVFREMIKIVETWPTFEVLEQQVLSKVRNVTWKKLVSFTKLEPEELEEAANDLSNMSTTDLKNICRTDNPRPGRAPVQLESAEAVLQDVSSRCQSLVRRIENVWLRYAFTDEDKKAYNESDDVFMIWEDAFSALNTLQDKLTELMNSWSVMLDITTEE